jgi:hypothetical protein
MEKYIFRIKLSRLLSVFFLLLGGIFFFMGLEMVFLHNFIPINEDAGFKFGGWFCLIAGGLVGFTGVQNFISPMTLISVCRKGISLKAKPGPTRQLTLIGWNDIQDIGEGEIIMHSGKGGRTVHKTVKLVLKPQSALAQSRITDGMVRWNSKEINFDSTYFAADLGQIIKALKGIKSDPAGFDELNLDVKYFLQHYRK